MASTTFTDGVTLTDDEWFNHTDETVYFLQAGTGSVKRRATLKLNEILSVKDYGAVGDGSTDDSTAIQAATTYAASIGAEVFFPPTSSGYKVSTGITSALPVRWKGSVGSKILTTSDITILALTAAAASFSTIDTLEFQGPGTGSSTKPGIKLTNVNNAKFYNIYVHAFSKGVQYAAGAVAPQSCYLCAMYDCRIYSNTTNIDAEAATNALFLSNCTIGGGASVGLKLLDSNNLTVIGGDAEGCTTCVFDLDATTDLNAVHTIQGFHFESNTCSAGDVRIGNTAAVRGVSLYGNLYGPAAGNDSSVNAIRGSGLIIDGGALLAGYTGLPFERIGASFDADTVSVRGIKTTGGGAADRQFVNFKTPTPASLTYLSPSTYDSNYGDAGSFDSYRVNGASVTASKNYYAKLGVINLSSGTPATSARMYALGGRVLNNAGGDNLRGVLAEGMDVVNLPFSLDQTATATPVAASGTISTSGLSSVIRVSPATAIASVVLQAGTRPGQICAVVNEAAAANTITFAAAGTSNVADGTSAVLSGLRSMVFVWDTSTSRWYRTG